jgi:hypothetical protein
MRSILSTGCILFAHWFAVLKQWCFQRSVINHFSSPLSTSRPPPLCSSPSFLLKVSHWSQRMNVITTESPFPLPTQLTCYYFPNISDFLSDLISLLVFAMAVASCCMRLVYVRVCCIVEV